MKTFKQTSDELYDRQHYKLVYSNGESIILDNYEDVQVRWFQTPTQLLSHVEVIDKQPNKGFK